MSLINGRDYVYLVWKEPTTRRQYVVGQLSKNGKYEFSYGFEVEAAIKAGFNRLIPFENTALYMKAIYYFLSFLVGYLIKKEKELRTFLQNMICMNMTTFFC